MSRIRVSRAQLIGLPVAATLVMFGVVFLANAQIYRWPGLAAGLVMTIAGLWMGWKSHRSARDRVAAADHNGDANT